MRTAGWLRAFVMLGLVLVWVTGAWAQTSTPPTPQFGFTGFIQEATLDTGHLICTPPNDPATGLPSPRLRGGTMTVNGIKLIVPCNTLLQLPAATMMFADLFDPLVSAPVGTTYIGYPAIPVPANPIVGSAVKTGLALADYPFPFPSFAVNAVGNVVGKNPDGTDRYIVALIVPVTQQDLNIGSGIVSCIDYTNGSFRVGGAPSSAVGGACPATGATGVLVQFNDPGFVVSVDPVTLQEVRDGRWGLAHSPDPRFSGDNENSTIHTSTGFPLCIPRVAPPAYDPKCPVSNGPAIQAGLPNTGNRPLNGDGRFPTDPYIPVGAPLKIFQMPAPVPVTQQVCDPVTLVCVTQLVIDPATGEPTNTVTPDAYKQVPLMVGDQVIYSGTLFKINPAATVVDPVTGLTIPDNTPANTYVSAHTVESVMEILTAPGVPPAYVFVEGVLIGTGGAAVGNPPILQEATTRLTVVGFTSDPTRLVDIYAQDVNPCTGQTSLRLLATTDPATQAFRTRFVHRVLGGLFMPPTRNYVIKTRTQFVDPVTLQPVDTLVANGVLSSQFLLPNFEFIVPENHRFGDPIIPGNYQDIPFLAKGSGPVDGFGTASPILGQLTPWPGIPAPTPAACAAGGGTLPIVNAGPDIAVTVNAQVTLTGNVVFDGGDDPLTRTVLWTQTLGDPVTLSTPTAQTTTFTAPTTPQVLTFNLAATDNFGTASDQVNITVLAQSDSVQITLASWKTQKGKRGGFGVLAVTATSSDPTAVLTLDVTTRVAGPCPDGTTVAAGGVCHLGPGIPDNQIPGTFNWTENKGVPEPDSLTVHSDKAGVATVPCGPQDNKGTLTCP